MDFKIIWLFITFALVIFNAVLVFKAWKQLRRSRKTLKETEALMLKSEALMKKAQNR